MARSSSSLQDPTVLAIPAYFATMGGEYLVMRRRPESAGAYERKDTLASLTMGLLSLVAPYVMQKALKPFVPGRGRWGRAVISGAVGAALATTIGDAVARRCDPGTRRGRQARQVTRVAGPVATVLGGVAVATTWQSRLSVGRLWRRRVTNRRRSLLAAIVGWDFIYYWNHRFMHESRYMWAVHVVHHSSEHYNLSTALRQPVLEAVSTPIPYGLLCLAGITPNQVELARGFNLLYQYWIHTESIGRLGPAELPLNTPSHHRVHHGSNGIYLDRNHGSILIVWDRLFGTFEAESDAVVYGLTKNINTFDPGRIATHEFVSILRDVAGATSWKERFGYIGRGPGWAAQHKRDLLIGS